jgi:hypothetical protein
MTVGASERETHLSAHQSGCCRPQLASAEYPRGIRAKVWAMNANVQVRTLRVLVCKSVAKASKGSNPSPIVDRPVVRLSGRRARAFHEG